MVNALSISSTLEFEPTKLRGVLEALLQLRSELRPTAYSRGESEPSKPIKDIDHLLNSISANEPGPHLVAPNATYDISCVPNKPILCRAFFEVDPSLVVEFLKHMANNQPTFGFACLPEERESKNRVIVKQSENSIESWVGRDPQKYIPGLYWLTLIREDLLKKHEIPLSRIEKVAKENFVLAGNEHLFRFYDSPRDWQSSIDVADLTASLSGVFDIEKVRPQFEASKNFLELHALVTHWK